MASVRSRSVSSDCHPADTSRIGGHPAAKRLIMRAGSAVLGVLTRLGVARSTRDQRGGVVSHRTCRILMHLSELLIGWQILVGAVRSPAWRTRGAVAPPLSSWWMRGQGVRYRAEPLLRTQAVCRIRKLSALRLVRRCSLNLPGKSHLADLSADLLSRRAALGRSHRQRRPA